MERMELIRKKKHQLIARKILTQMPNITLINFEEDNFVIETLESTLLQFYKIGAKADSKIVFGKEQVKYNTWLFNELDFFKDKKMWLIGVPNCNDAVWANVLISNFRKAILSLWTISESNEFVIADKESGQIIAVCCEETCYEIYKKLS